MVNIDLFDNINIEVECVPKEYAELKKSYTQKSIKKRLEAFLFDNVGRIATREQIQEVAKDPISGRIPENWHQRLSELRTDDGYTILSSRDGRDIKISEYILVSPQKRSTANKRIIINPATWLEVLKQGSNCCQWEEGGLICGLKDGDIDPVTGGRVKLTPDHKTPHSMCSNIDPNDANAWQPLCGRHQVVKKNYWDHSTGKMNFHAVVQAASLEEKKMIYDLLTDFFS